MPPHLPIVQARPKAQKTTVSPGSGAWTRPVTARGTPGRKPFSTRDVFPRPMVCLAQKQGHIQISKHRRTLDSVNLHHSFSSHGLSWCTTEPPRSYLMLINLLPRGEGPTTKPSTMCPVDCLTSGGTEVKEETFRTAGQEMAIFPGQKRTQLGTQTDTTLHKTKQNKTQ